jgi:predicted RNA polymerase sigma factor
MSTHRSSRHVTLWIVQGILAALFLFAGGMKLATPVAELARLSPLPAGFLKFIGACEALGALGLVLPGLFRLRLGLTPLAAAGLVVIMLGAARVALTLRLPGGLTTAEIGRAFLLPESTIAQRTVRAKRTLADVRADSVMPRGAELAARIPSVLEVIYLIFNEGYAATAGDDWMRPSLCDEAPRLGRVLAGLVPDEPEVQGLVALMELQASRTQARTDASGDPVLLVEQNRRLWNRLFIRRGLAALERAESLEAARGPYTLQAAIVACHARARTAEATDWERIVVLYGELAEVMPSPVVDLNRAIAVGMAYGPSQALELVDALVARGRLRDYHLLPSVRGDLLGKLGRLGSSSSARRR